MSRFSFAGYIFFTVYLSYALTVQIPQTIIENEDPDVFRNVSQLITSKGYPVEEYEVSVKGGYIIGVQRIPRGRNESNTSHRGRSNNILDALRLRDERPVVLLHHGLLGTAADYLFNLADQSLGYILADSGYDVWLINARGSTYSRKHESLSPKTSAYWQFSWDEMALIDLPATVDFILNKTGQEKLSVVGGSMGSTILLAFLAEYPIYNDKVRVAVNLCPVAFAGNVNSPIRYLVPFANKLAALDAVIGHDELLPGSIFEHLVTEWFCTESPHICQNFVLALSGASAKHFNATRATVYLGHLPGGTSVFTVLHYAQLIKSKSFCKYDYGPEENFRRYGQATPPSYPVQNITTPVALLWGLNDKLADPADVNLLTPLLQNLVLSYQIPDPEWGHGDFFIGVDANTIAYQKVLDILKKY